MVDFWLKMDNYIPAEEDIERLKREGFIRNHKVPLQKKEEQKRWFTLEVALSFTFMTSVVNNSGII